MSQTPARHKVLEVENLRTVFRVEGGEIAIVDGVSFSVGVGETFCIVGESGSGKSMLALSLMGLLPASGKIAGGSVRLDGTELTSLDREGMRRLRGNRMAMIFQEPMTSLNPVFTIGDQIVEALTAHGRSTSHGDLRRRAVELLDLVKLPNAAGRISAYPHELSGGQRQRVMIAMALACDPQLLIADEPTTALDVTVQEHILELLGELQRERSMAIVMITHDLGVVSDMADNVAVMYAGRFVENAPARQLFDDPQHPYSIGLLGSIPRIDRRQDRLLTIEGVVPSPANYPTGCRFHPRCVFGADACTLAYPQARELSPGHTAACIRAPIEELAP